MPHLIVVEPRDVKPKGLRQNSVSREKLKEHLFDSDYVRLDLLEKVAFPQFQENAVLFYPGCGADILYPLLYLERLPSLRSVHCILNDFDDPLMTIKTILDDLGVSFEAGKNKINFWWNHLLVSLEFLQGNVFALPLPHFDIYFERAFRIMKDGDFTYEQRIFEKLASGGLLISDSGFWDVPLERIAVASELSSYGEMVVGRKKSSLKNKATV